MDHCFGLVVTSVALPLVHRVTTLSALLLGECSESLLPAQLLSRIVPSQCLARCSGTGSYWRCACYSGPTLTLIILTSKLPFSAMLRLGVVVLKGRCVNV